MLIEWISSLLAEIIMKGQYRQSVSTLHCTGDRITRAINNEDQM